MAVLVLLGGCERSEGVGSTGVARDSAGIRIVGLPDTDTNASPIALSIDPSWAPAGELEIGDLLDIAVIPGRGVLLLDELAGSVTFLSDAGEVLSVLGRDGQGPGEFNPQGLSQIVATDSSVFVPDLFLQRLTEFSLDGEVLRIQSFPISPVYAVDWRSSPDGALAFRAMEQFGDQIIRLAGETADTILSSTISNDFGNVLLVPVTLWDLTEEGDVLFARTDRAVVEFRRGGTGEVVWIARWPQMAEELSEAAVEHLEGLVRDQILRDTPDIAGEQLTESLAMIEYPNEGPVLAGLLAGLDGEVWVRRAKPIEAMDREALLLGSTEGIGGEDWDVLTSEGFLKARVRFPPGFTPRRFSAGWVYGILADEMGVETVARVQKEF
jgi:hypothetical protein